MKRTHKGDKNARAERFAQTHRRRVGTNYADEWAENLSEKLKVEWEENHHSSDSPTTQQKPKKDPSNHKKK